MSLWFHMPLAPARSVFSSVVHFRRGKDPVHRGERHIGCSHIQTILSGHYVVECREKQFIVEAGDLFIFPRDKQCTYLHLSDTIRTQSVFFRSRPGDRLEAHAEADLSESNLNDDQTVAVPVHVKHERTENLGDLMSQIQPLCAEFPYNPEPQDPSTMHRHIQAELLLKQVLLGMAGSELPQKRSATPMPHVRMVIKRIMRDSATSHSIDQLARAFGVSPSTLKRHFQKQVGMSIKQFHNQIRLGQAHDLLKRAPDLPLSEVAERLGFYDEFHFSRFFKAKAGVSPSELRKQLEPEKRLG